MFRNYRRENGIYSRALFAMIHEVSSKWMGGGGSVLLNESELVKRRQQPKVQPVQSLEETQALGVQHSGCFLQAGFLNSLCFTLWSLCLSGESQAEAEL